MMRPVRLGELGDPETPSIEVLGNTTKKYHNYCLASWLFKTKAEDEIKRKWLKRWPHVQPYLRVIAISTRVRNRMEISSQHSFLEYWKQAIRITGHVAVLANEDQVDRAFDKSQLRLKGFDELSSLIPKKNEPDRKLLALMISIFNPDWGSQICETYRIDISTSMELNAEYTLIYLGLLTTYNGF